MSAPEAITVEIQKLEPSAIIELFELDGTAFGGDLLRFHAGTNQLRQSIVWQGNTYTPFPLQATGFDYSGNGQLPRPKMVVSNVSGAITLLVLTYDDLLGAKVTRKRTLAKYLDAVNFPGATNPAADPTAEFGDEIFFIDRKVTENRDIVEFELAAAFDVAGVRLPRRQIIQNICTWKYRGGECGWTTPDPRRNLLTFTEEFDNAAWSKTGVVVTPNAAIAPNGTLTADKIAKSAVTQFHFLSRDAPTGLVTASASFQAAGLTTATIFLTQSGNNGATFNLSAVTASAIGAGNTATIESEGSGWFRCILTQTNNSASGVRFGPGDGALASSLGDGLAGVNMWGAQVEAASSASVYQPVGASYTNPTYYDADDASVASIGLDVCGKRLSSCKVRFGATAPLPFGSFPAAGLTR